MRAIIRWARRRESRTVCVANIHLVMQAHQDPQFNQLLSEADMVTPGGRSLVWILKRMGIPQDRVAGMDMLLRLCQLASEHDVRVFFLGSERGILQRIAYRLQQDFPQLKVAGLEPLPFHPLTPEEKEQIVQRINDSGAGIVFVSMGCPRQEQFINQYRDSVNAVMIAVGTVFPVYAGAKKWVPLWIKQAGLEWFYQLVQKPKRLWNRYGRITPRFLWLAMQQVIAQHLAQETVPDDFVVPHLPVYQPLGEILQRAGLLSAEQVRHILKIQSNHRNLRFGEIQAQQGWLKPETVDFFADYFPHFAVERHKQPLGHYLQSAGLLDEIQVEAILAQQHENGLRFGEIAVSYGWVKQETVSLFLKYMNPNLVPAS
ncbi:MAG: WecB/TagA/CpsF family glycosyltransferase [Microcoleaceae cyanobacterium]